MHKDILVFAGKQVGLQLVMHLLKLDAPIRRIVVASDSDNKILELVAKSNITATIYNRQVQEQLAEEKHRYEWLLNLWSPHILCQGVLDLAAHRLNIHPSLVPHCQGNDNAAWTIRKDLPAGVSLIEMSGDLDKGAIYVQKQIPYSFPTLGRDLHAVLQKESVQLFKDSWPSVYAGALVPTPQNGPASHHTRKQTEKDRTLNASEILTVEGFIRWIQAHDFSPGTTAEVKYQERTYKLTLNVEQKASYLQTDRESPQN